MTMKMTNYIPLRSIYKQQMRTVATVMGTVPTVPIARQQITGAGPFRASPQFTTVGNPSTLLSISIPQSSEIYLSQSSIIALNGDFDNVYADNCSIYGVPYQKLVSSAASNIIVSGRTNYKILDLSKHWTIQDLSKVVGWAGIDVKVQKVKTPLTIHNSIELSGKGTAVIDGSSQIFEIDVQDGEKTYVNPNALIAVLGAGSNAGIVATANANANAGAIRGNISVSLLPHPTYELSRLDVPRIHWSWPHWIVNPVNNIKTAVKEHILALNTYRIWYKTNVYPYWAPISEMIYTCWRKSYSYINGRLIRRKPLFIEVQGPCTVLLDNLAMLRNGQMFTSAKISKVFK